MPQKNSRVWVEIDLATLRDNFHAVADLVAPAKVIAVLKANAYGLGVKPIAETLVKCGVDGFAAAELHEAIELAAAGLPVQLLGTALPDELPEAIAHGITVTIGGEAEAKTASNEAKRQGKTVECCFAVDTGMGRVGMLWDQALGVIPRCMAFPNLSFTGIYSHFPSAYKSSADITRRQIERFTGIVANAGVPFQKIHIANSDAINNFPETHQPPFTHVRTGINLHGSFDPEGKRALKLKPVLTLKTRLGATRELPEGYTIGYGCTYRLPRPTRVGTITAGYADGLPLALSNRGYVLIRGRVCPILGRVSMDYTTIDLSQVPEATVGDEVICLGGEGPLAISVEDWAVLKGTHPYDILCSLGGRVARTYLNP